jgi:hypothetical protein
MCPQLKISEEFFFFFRDGWIELFKLHQKKYVSNLEKYFTKKAQDTIICKYKGARPKILTFVKYFFLIWNILFLMQLDELYSTITKKEKKILLKLSIVDTLHTV